MDKYIISGLLKIGVGGNFVAHSIAAFQGDARLAKYLTWVGINSEAATLLLPLLGAIHMLVGVAVLLKPLPWILLYATVWSFFTALLPWLYDYDWLAFVQQSTCWTSALAIYLILYRGIKNNR
ncbi:MAG: hypothetical protein IPL35_16425 [Sphingobacteriales bacterium]|nr:hypothetical protein [Sphingobacteriales bacterium]